MKYVGLFFLAWGICVLTFAIAAIGLRAAAFHAPPPGAIVRVAIGAGLLLLGWALYNKNAAKNIQIIKYCPNADCPILEKMGMVAEYQETLATCPECGTLLVATTEPELKQVNERIKAQTKNTGQSPSF